MEMAAGEGKQMMAKKMKVKSNNSDENYKTRKHR